MRIPEGFIQALVATSRHDSIPADMDSYAPVPGDWEITGTESVTNPPQPVKMKVNFVRALDGRAQSGCGHRADRRQRQGEPRRWIFSEITHDSFTWRGEGSEDGGQTWRLHAEYFAKRRG